MFRIFHEDWMSLPTTFQRNTNIEFVLCLLKQMLLDQHSCGVSFIRISDFYDY